MSVASSVNNRFDRGMSRVKSFLQFGVKMKRFLLVSLVSLVAYGEVNSFDPELWVASARRAIVTVEKMKGSDLIGPGTFLSKAEEDTQEAWIKWYDEVCPVLLRHLKDPAYALKVSALIGKEYSQLHKQAQTELNGIDRNRVYWSKWAALLSGRRAKTAATANAEYYAAKWEAHSSIQQGKLDTLFWFKDTWHGMLWYVYTVVVEELTLTKEQAGYFNSIFASAAFLKASVP